MDTAPLDPALDPLRNDDGGFTMVALDQRESLRQMFPGSSIGDDALRSFKRTAAEVLTPHASGVLLDRPLAVTEPARPDWIDPDCGLLLAADVLHSTSGAGVDRTELDELVTPDFVRATGASAVKYLVIWRRGDASHRPDLSRFLQLASDAGVGSFVEGIVQPPHGEHWLDEADRHDAILEAAIELSSGASVYKAQVPGYTPGDLSQVENRSRELSAAIDEPWVVLSNGVQRSEYASAVAATLRGGSSGFLAGRAIWADTVGASDPSAELTATSVPRLEHLSALVAEAMRERAISW